MSAAEASSSRVCPFLRQSFKRNYSTMAESHREISLDSLFVPEDDHYTLGHGTLRIRSTGGLALPSRRVMPHFVGDGLDFRRPTMSEGVGSGEGSHTASRSTPQVIDLTAEDDARRTESEEPSRPIEQGTTTLPRAQRPPRFGRNIIDVDGEEDEEPLGEASHEQSATPGALAQRDRHNLYTQHPRFSVLRRPNRINAIPAVDMGDLELVEERPRSRPQTNSPSNTPAMHAPRSLTPYPTGVGEFIDLTGDDDDVVHVNTVPRPAENLIRPAATAGAGTRSYLGGFFGGIDIGDRLGARIGDRLRGLFVDIEAEERDILEQTRHERPIHADPRRVHHRPAPRRVHVHPTVRAGNVANMPFMMEYGVAAFDMGFEGHESAAAKYEPPVPAADGFTRSPGEDEIVVCPNCGDELAMGASDEKQEVWVIRKCGHAYCGDCVKNHTTNKPKKGKGKGKAPVTAGTQTFKHCVVDGCKEAAGKKQMVMVFLSS